MTILPSLPTSTRTTSSPAAFAALIAAVTSRCLKVSRRLGIDQFDAAFGHSLGNKLAKATAGPKPFSMFSFFGEPGMKFTFQNKITWDAAENF